MAVGILLGSITGGELDLGGDSGNETLATGMPSLLMGILLHIRQDMRAAMNLLVPARATGINI